jgi:hypothetical protein
MGDARLNAAHLPSLLLTFIILFFYFLALSEVSEVLC